MKKIVTLCICLSLFIGLFSQDEQYIALMKESIDIMDKASNIYQLQQAANQFERIGEAMQNRWLPYYYSAYSYVQISHIETSDKRRDLYIDKAVELNDKAETYSSENSEIYVMKGFILQARMDVDPMVRGLKYNKKCLKMFEKAKELDPENPRSYLWHGVNLFNTPSFMGGGKDKARPLLENACEKFHNYHLPSPIDPNWGEKYAEEILNKCKE